MIEFDHVSVAYKDSAPVFMDWSFVIQDNSIVTILGANGIGKTTLLKCLTNQMRPFEGTVTIDGAKVSSMPAKLLAKKIAFVPQYCNAEIDYSVLDFITFGRSPYLGLLEGPSQYDYKHAYEMTKKHGITHLIEKSVNNISGGERQLVYIARALVQDTPIIIMDEPMSALDFGNQAVILKKILELADDGKTILLTSHNPNHALSISSEVLIIRQDKKIVHGNAVDLLCDNELLENTFGDRVSYSTSSKNGYITFTP